MRIGVYFNETEPQAGGAFTFEDDLLKALLRKASNAPKNEFFVISKSLQIDKYKSKKKFPLNLKFLILDNPNIFEKVIEWMKRRFLCPSQLSKFKGPLEKLARKNKLDLIWFMGGGCYEATNTPFIATVWDLQHRLQPWFPEVSADGIWADREVKHRWFLSRASYIIVGSEAGREEVEFFYQIPKFRIYKFPHPTPYFAFNSDKKENIVDVIKKYKIPLNYIFYPAQFWPHKNHVNLLHAVKIIQHKYKLNLHLVLTGSDKGNKSHVMQVANNLGLLKRVHFLDFVAQSDMGELYKNALMLAFVSLCGPENLPPLEAFASKCPVIATKVPGSKEQFGNAALFCDGKNPENIADKIYHLHKDSKLRQRLIKNGYDRSVAWTADDFVKGIFKIIDEFESIKRNWQ